METLIEKLKTAEKCDGNVVEVIFEDGEENYEITVNELMEANQLGFVYHSSRTGIDYEDYNSERKLIVKYMDIHYFSIAPKDIHKFQMPE